MGEVDLWPSLSCSHRRGVGVAFAWLLLDNITLVRLLLDVDLAGIVSRGVLDTVSGGESIRILGELT